MESEIELTRKNMKVTVLESLYFLWIGANVLFPGDFVMFKMALTLLLAMISFTKLVFTGKIYAASVFKGTVIFLIVIVFSLIFGLSNGYMIDSSVLSTYILRPILIWLLVSLFVSTLSQRGFISILILVSFIVEVYNFVYILGALGIIPQLFFWESDSLVLTTDQFLTARLTNQASLTFFLPLTGVLSINNVELTSFQRKITWLGFLLGIFAALLSGRRILQIVVIITILLLLFIDESRTLKKIFTKFIIAFTSGISALFLGSWISDRIGMKNIFLTIIQTIQKAFDSDDYSTNLRFDQLDILTDFWKLKPFFGHGINSYVPNYIRNETQKWSYEFVYNAFLFQLGIIGFSVLLVIVFRVFKTIWNYTGEFNSISKAIFIGGIFFVVASVTNPMIASFWFWFIILCMFEYSKIVANGLKK